METTDLLSDFLSPCQIQCRDTQLWRMTAPWGLKFRHAGPGFVIVLEGACLLRTSGADGELALRQNDLVVFTHDAAFALCDRAESRLVAVERLVDGSRGGPHEQLRLGGGGAATRLLSGALAGKDDYTRQAFALMPPLLLARGDAPEIAAGMGPLLRLFLEELEQHRPGGELVADRILQAMLVYALRITPLALPESAGLLPSLALPGLGMAIGAIHSRPQHEWSVRELADLAGLSRSKFALKFVEVLGRPPVDYVRDVRMRLACRLLHETDRGIKEIAAKVGYATESSFSKAFVRSCGCAPGEYRRRNKGAAHSEDGEA